MYGDPPWKLLAGPGRHPDKHYRTMKFKDLLAMGPAVAELAHPEGCRFVFWTTAPFLEKAFQFMRACGFRYSTCRVWAKLWPKEDGLFIFPDSMSRGTGYESIDDREFLIIAKRGRPERIPPGKQPRGLFFGRRTKKHSEKPEFVRDELRRMFAGPRLELFSRHEREDWMMWGEEVGKLDEAEAVRPGRGPARVWSASSRAGSPYGSRTGGASR